MNKRAEAIHELICAEAAEREYPGVVAQWATVVYLVPPPDNDGGDTQGYMMIFSDDHMASHNVLGLAAILDRYSSAQLIGLGSIGDEE